MKFSIYIKFKKQAKEIFGVRTQDNDYPYGKY